MYRVPMSKSSTSIDFITSHVEELAENRENIGAKWTACSFARACAWYATQHVYFFMGDHISDMILHVCQHSWLHLRYLYLYVRILVLYTWIEMSLINTDIVLNILFIYVWLLQNRYNLNEATWSQSNDPVVEVWVSIHSWNAVLWIRKSPL